MGIESDQLVFDYLSRVGDLAQQRQLPSGTRMRLVSELRNEIEARRAKTTVDSPAAVRRILERLGSPDEVVTGAGTGRGAAQPEAPRAAVPVQRSKEQRPKEPRPKGLRRIVPGPRAEPQEDETSRDAPSPPHLAGTDELGAPGSEPDWWRVDSSPFGVADSVPGFVGGVEIPEILRPPGKGDPRPPKARRAGADTDEELPDDERETGTGKGTEEATRRRRLPSLPGWSNPLLLLAAALLVAGAVMGNWFALGLGWIIAYASRRLSEGESKAAVLWLPGLAVAAGLVWLWGRNTGRWGEPIADGRMSDAISTTWPWVVRGAAVASALFVVWRSQRQRP
ncbi:MULTISPECIES: hypothetical protein [unclassified Streptomyces]|uniref:Integral membrane protein n=1 Tax=Streptomyces sp. NBC_00119 TaxID=2975659 RepID=A0AAU1UC46_9ACTN|nr:MULTISPECIES: hypothetical protein [unclassified Streptomyces]MCX4644729.1 hypothetical protein [Streptomyces sp. NBC_01446]MCX5326616.1 hypothetical protein [Streptomyces sp. NBC_00120]